MNCPKCNAEIKETAKFCTKCGVNLKKFEEQNSSAFYTESENKKDNDSFFCDWFSEDVSIKNTFTNAKLAYSSGEKDRAFILFS